MNVGSRIGLYEVVWPRGNKVVEAIPYALRLDSLAGKTICELSDRIFRADEVFPFLVAAYYRKCYRVTVQPRRNSFYAFDELFFLNYQYPLGIDAVSIRCPACSFY